MGGRGKANGELAETLIRLTREHTEALVRLAHSQQVVATEVAAAAVARIEIAKHMALVAERLDHAHDDDITRSAATLLDMKAHITMESETVQATTRAAIRATATPRLIAWLIAASAVVIAGALSALVVVKSQQGGP